MMEEKQELMTQDVKEMMTELIRNNGPSESSSAEGSAAVRGSSRGIESTSVRETFVAAAGGGALGDSTATIETTWREDGSRNFGLTGRRGAAVPVEVVPVRGQPYQQSGAGEWGAYAGGELGFVCDLPLSRLALKPTVVQSFSGKKIKFTAWTSDARYYAKGAGFLFAFVPDPPKTFPKGNWISRRRYLSTGDTVAKVCTYMHWRGISCRRLSRARATKSILHR